jgi:hypothetical protein
MNDNDYNILEVRLSGEGNVRATNAVSDPDNHRNADTRRLSISVSGSIDTGPHPWAKTFKKIEVTLYFSDEIPVDDFCAFLSASEICLEGDVVYRESLDIEAFLPTASFTMVSQILTSSRSGRPMLFLLIDDDIAAWAAQDDPELLKAQECAFDYDIHTLAAFDEQVREEVTEQTGVDTAPHPWRRRGKQIVAASVSGDRVVLGVVIFVTITMLFFVQILIDVFE